MKITRAHKIRLYPNKEQQQYFAKACGISRLSYNWGRANWQNQYREGGKPSANGLKKEFNSIKDEEFPFIREVAYGGVEMAFEHLNSAYSHFFRRVAENNEDRQRGKRPRNKKVGYPKFKKKAKAKNSFTLSHTKYRVEGKRIRLPRIGWIKMAEELRFQGKLGEVTVSRTANRWFASIVVKLEVPDKKPVGEPLGVDVGIKHLAITSTGQTFDNPKAYKRNLRKLKRLHRELSRKQKDSKNRLKAKARLAKQYYKVSCVRSDAQHKVSHEIANLGHSDLVVETLGIQDMLKNRHMSQALSDASLYELKRQMKYKAKAEGTRVTEAPRYYASSKICSACGAKKDSLKLSDRVYRCDACGFTCDRDVNAALNLKSLIVKDKAREAKALAEAKARKKAEADKKRQESEKTS